MDKHIGPEKNPAAVFMWAETVLNALSWPECIIQHTEHCICKWQNVNRF